MTNEATKVELYGPNRDGEVRRYTIASSATITKGQALSLNDGRIASAANSATPNSFAGIANADKTTDYSTSIGAWTQAIVSVVASGGVTEGYPAVCTATTDHPNTYGMPTGASQASGATIAGYFEDTVSDGERVNMRLNL